jgi:hypothetical protein
MEKESNFNKLYDILQEELQLGSNYSMYGNTKGDALGVGNKGLNFSPERTSLLDVVDSLEKEKSKTKADNPVMAYPLQSKITEDLSEVVVKLSELVTKFSHAGGNPIIKENPKAVKTVKRIVKKLSHAGGVVMSLKEDIDDLVVDK